MASRKCPEWQEAFKLNEKNTALTLMVSSNALRKSMGLAAGHACLGLSDLAQACALLAASQALARVSGRPTLVLYAAHQALPNAPAISQHAAKV